MSATEYKISIKGDGLSFEQSVPLELAKRLVAMAASGGALGRDQGSGSTGGVEKGTHHQDGDGGQEHLALSEYIAKHETKRIIEQITAIGEYLRVYRSKASFTKADLEAGFEEAGESVPKNLARDLVWAKKAGWIAPKTGVEGEYYVTTSGRAAIKANFGPEIKKKSKASAGGRKRKKAAATST